MILYVNQRKIKYVAYPFVVNLRILDLKPTRSHNPPLHDKKLKCISVGAKYSSDIGALSIHGYLRFYESTHYNRKLSERRETYR